MEKHFNPAPELMQLNFLIGNWHSEGELLANSSRPSVRISGTDSYEWVAGGFFILHRVDVLMGDEPVEVIELIGYDPLSNTYSMKSFDNKGEFTMMEANIDPLRRLHISGEMVRSTLVPGKDGNKMTASWDRTDDGSTWIPWIEMKFIK
ncbi:MAG: DUF1579 family protein [Chitinophagaceae bacterium]